MRKLLQSGRRQGCRLSKLSFWGHLSHLLRCTLLRTTDALWCTGRASRGRFHVATWLGHQEPWHVITLFWGLLRSWFQTKVPKSPSSASSGQAPSNHLRAGVRHKGWPLYRKERAPPVCWSQATICSLTAPALKTKLQH